MRQILLLLLVAVVAAAIGRWTAPSAARERAPVTTAAITPAEPAVARRPRQPDVALPEPVVSPPPAFIPPESPAPDRRGLGFDPANFLAGLPQLLEQLSDRAGGNDPAALGEVADWLDYCASVKLAVLASTAARPNPYRNFASHRDAQVMAYFNQVTTTCRGWIERHPWLIAENAKFNEIRNEYLRGARAGQVDTTKAPAGSLASLLRRRAAENGDLLARSRGTKQFPCPSFPPTSDPAVQRANYRQIQVCLYQSNREILLRALSSRDPRVIAVVPQLTTNQNYNWQQGFLSNTMYSSSLWALAACQIGLDCSASGAALRDACARGMCGYPHLRDYIADRQQTPAHMRSIDATLPQLVALIRAGDVDAILGPPPPS